MRQLGLADKKPAGLIFWALILLLLLPFELPAQNFVARLFKSGKYARYKCVKMGAYNKHRNGRVKQETRHRSTKELTPGTITQANPRAPVVRPPKNNPPGPPTTKPPTDFPVAKVTTTPSSAPPTKPEIPPDQPSESGPPHRKNPFKEMTQEEKRKTLLEMKPELILPPIRFITAQDEFSVVNMDSFMQAMEYAQQGKIVLIEGHTDDVGSDDSNLKLSMKRAEKIRQLMISGGVNDDLLSEIGFGETQPLVPNTSAENRAVNRRIEFKIFSAPE